MGLILIQVPLHNWCKQVCRVVDAVGFFLHALLPSLLTPPHTHTSSLTTFLPPPSTHTHLPHISSSLNTCSHTHPPSYHSSSLTKHTPPPSPHSLLPTTHSLSLTHLIFCSHICDLSTSRRSDRWLGTIPKCKMDSFTTYVDSVSAIMATYP